MVGEVLLDRYELQELVGSGGMSSVYRAHDRLLDRMVALKVLHEHYRADPEYVERFRREARSVAVLSHPNIVTVIDRGEQANAQFIVFEYVDGENLKRLIERERPLPVARRSPSPSRLRAASRSRTETGSSIATSSRRTCCSTATARRRSRTSGSRERSTCRVA